MPVKYSLLVFRSADKNKTELAMILSGFSTQVKYHRKKFQKQQSVTLKHCSLLRGSTVKQLNKNDFKYTHLFPQSLNEVEVHSPHLY